MSLSAARVLSFFLPALLLIPVFLLFRFVLFRSWRRTAAYYVFALYLSGLWMFCGLPGILNGVFSPEISAVPFVGMVRDPLGAIFTLAVFLPYGFMLPLFWKRYRDGWKVIPAGFSLALFLALGQLFGPDAVPSVDLLILGTLGTWIGYFIACVLILSNPRIDETAPAEGTIPERFALFIAVCGVMFFIFPLLSSLLTAPLSA